MVHSNASRGMAMHTGALAAKGDILLFLHADCLVPMEYDAELRNEFNDPDVVATAFTFAVNKSEMKDSSKQLVGLSTMSFFTNVRCHYFQLPYGDQGLAFPRSIYDAFGGFPDVKIMEDFELVVKIRQQAVQQVE